MRRIVGMLSYGAILLLLGCSGKAPPTEPPTGPQRPAGVRRMFPKVDRTVAGLQLKNLGLAYANCVDTMGRPPAKIEDLAKFGGNDPETTRAVKEGLYIICWDVDIRRLQDASNTVLGYVFDVPDIGGAVLMCDGSIKEMSPDEFKRAQRPPGKK
jgi:hypothetical protein